MSNLSQTCGEVGGRNRAGLPCGLRATKGRRCRLHRDQLVVAILPRAAVTFDPERLHPTARAVWDAHRAELSPEKRAALEFMCMVLDRALAAFAELLAGGNVVADPAHAGVKVNPAWRVFREAQVQYRAWVEFFGDGLGVEEKPTGLDEIRAMR